MPGRRGQGSIPGQLQEEKDLWGDWDTAGSPCVGILSESLSPPSWTGNSQAGGGGGRGAGQVVRRDDSQLEPELHLSAPNFSVPDALLGDSFALYSWLRQPALNESQRGPPAMGRAHATRRRTSGYGRAGSLREADVRGPSRHQERPLSSWVAL